MLGVAAAILGEVVPFSCLEHELEHRRWLGSPVEMRVQSGSEMVTHGEWGLEHPNQSR